MCTMSRRELLKKAFAATALVSTTVLGSMACAQSPGITEPGAGSKSGCGHHPHAGNGYCTVSGCTCPGFMDVGSSVCGRCYHSWNMHS